MTAEYYADQYQRYSTYIGDFGGNKVAKIACGPPNDNYHWTDVLMRQCCARMDGLALHYYCGSGKVPQPSLGNRSGSNCSARHCSWRNW